MILTLIDTYLRHSLIIKYTIAMTAISTTMMVVPHITSLKMESLYLRIEGMGRTLCD